MGERHPRELHGACTSKHAKLLYISRAKWRPRNWLNGAFPREWSSLYDQMRPEAAARVDQFHDSQVSKSSTVPVRRFLVVVKTDVQQDDCRKIVRQTYR